MVSSADSSSPPNASTTCEQQPGSAELGHFHEEAATDGEVELDALGRDIDRADARELRPQVGHARRQAEGQLLHGVGPGIVVDVGADGGRRHAHRVEFRPAGQLGHLVVGFVQRQRQCAFLGQRPQRIGSHAAIQEDKGRSGYGGGGIIRRR